MKKTYVSPLATEVSVAAESMLAASLQINSEKKNVMSQSAVYFLVVFAGFI